MKDRKSGREQLDITFYISPEGWVYTDSFGLLEIVGRLGDAGIKEKNGRRTLYIPKKIDGYEVYIVDLRGFMHGFDRLVVPEGVGFIGAGAFMGCTELREVRLPKSLLVLGENAFYGTAIPQKRIDALYKRYEGAFDACFPDPDEFAPRRETPAGCGQPPEAPEEPGSDIPF